MWASLPFFGVSKSFFFEVTQWLWSTYNASTQFIDYSAKTPADRLPSNAPRKVKVGFADGKA
jgi:hypothetical protein